MPAPFAPAAPVALPALYLYPLNDSFVPKHISLLNGQHVKIGRQTNAKTVPAERNGFFDSKVLSRQHAEVWEEAGEIYIKDVKSSNGTFINGERLSPEGVESDPFKLKSDDVVEFGIDIVGEDNKTIIHHKVAARVMCVFSEQDAAAAARAEASQGPPAYGSVGPGAPGGAFSFAGQPAPGAQGQQRRPSVPQQGLMGMGGMGGNVRPPGKSGFSFDHILSKLQGELQKSRDTGAELHSLGGAIGEIQDTLGGNLPPNLPPYPAALPPVMPAQAQQQQQQQEAAQQAHAAESASALNELQAQLRETQLSLAGHVDKIRALEGMLAEHDAIKREVGAMRELMEERKREMEALRPHSSSPPHRRRAHRPADDDAHDEQYSSDEDDARSISTVVAHALERVDEEDEDQLAAEDEERRRRRDELGRPRTPEPTGMGIDDDEQEHAHRRADPEMRSRSPSPPPAPAPVAAIPDELTERLASLSRQLETALETSRLLEAQHTSAQSTIALLESKVSALESLVQDTQSLVQTQAETTQQLVESVRNAPPPQPSLEEERARDRESITEMISEWKKSVEGRWSGVQEEWNDERERLRRAREEWESRMRAVEDGVGSAVSKLESGLVTLASFQAQHPPNGSARVSGGLVTPPSPRSLSADSTRPRQKRKRASTSRGRTRSRSSSKGAPSDTPSAAPEDVDGRAASPGARVRHRAPWSADDSDSETFSAADGASAADKDEAARKAQGMPFPITPESSVLNHPLSTNDVLRTATDSHPKEPASDVVGDGSSLNGCSVAHHNTVQSRLNPSTAVGILLLSAAAAAVIWRIKPDVSA
ncbi:hypothetical protein WOLCODRAFT_110944 [Wolfiporia cocos MD-104 SS10]|uniref:FHA domain-containing protein n=1 Tax=Wolfiporia cocos (strain MD-104) TaxID=742152 RepID=A0A2H3JSJ5_WOLCO|nr:hypothetical protein WOLCODRAFT_110944 [Wolfiporia cocos MD-104 SS10]